MIYAGPYISVAQAKWLTTIKENAEGNAPVEEAKVEEVKEEKTEE
jgi:hypothetical protein